MYRSSSIALSSLASKQTRFLFLILILSREVLFILKHPLICKHYLNRFMQWVLSYTPFYIGKKYPSSFLFIFFIKTCFSSELSNIMHQISCLFQWQTKRKFCIKFPIKSQQHMFQWRTKGKYAQVPTCMLPW